MKRIVFAVTNDLTYDRRMQRICSTLAENGSDVLLIGRKLNASLLIENQLFEHKRIKCWFNLGKLFYLEYNWRLFWVLLFVKGDIFSAVDLDTIAPLFLAAKLRGKKRVFDAHEYFSEVPEVVDRPMVKKTWERVGRWFVPMADAAYTVGGSLADIFTRQYGIEFETIRNVPFKRTALPNLDKAGQYLLYQGALNEGRGLEALIDAMEHIEMPLKIAGEGDLSQELRKRVEQKGLASKVEFLGFVKPADLGALTDHAFLGLNLLENKGLSYYYSLANKCFDYIQAGVPSLNMNFPEYKAIDEQYKVGLLLNDLETDTIVEAINGLIENSLLYKELRVNCITAASEYNWEEEAGKLLTLYRNV